MDKRILQTYSVWAKESLEKQIEVSLKTLGINGDKDIKKAKQVGDYTIIDSDPNSYPKDLLWKRTQIVMLVTDKGYNNVIEEFAYTWFNRFVALRFMEVHDFLPHGFRVLSNRNGGVEPEILKNLNFVQAELNLNMDTCATLKAQGKTEDLFRYILLQQCSALAEILPMLFAKDNDYLELLLPKSLLIGETIITKLVEIPEENFLNDVEIIGWMYQFYISVKKDEVFASKKPITKDTLPAVTQLFTPDWIVRYMAENSVGRIWMESYPQSALRTEMKYYVDDPEQTEEVKSKLEAIKYKNVNPEDIRVIEPCCGSGHILVYVFDLLYKMYEEKGYSNRDIPSLILKNNIVGLDVDKRAAQLAAFSLVMKARKVNPRFFSETYYVVPQVYEIYDSHYLESIGYRQHMENIGIFTDEEMKAVEELVYIFRNGKTIGSLIKVKSIKFEHIVSVISKLEHDIVASVFEIPFTMDGTVLLKKLFSQAKVLSTKYDVMITNPPYIGISSMEEPVKDYAVKNYPNSKSDMYAMFMETGFVKQNGFTAMINQQSWMYLVSFKGIRKSIVYSYHFVNFLHLGANVFDDIKGEVVQNCSFVFRKNDNKEYIFQLFNLQDADSANKKENNYLKKQYKKYLLTGNEILGKPHCVFDYDPKKYDLQKVVSSIDKDGVYRGPSFINNSVLRFWHEVSFADISTGYESISKWIPCSRNGIKIRWFTPIDEIIERSLLVNAANYHTQKKYGVLWNDSRFGSPTIIAKIKNSNISYESALNLITCDKDSAYMYLALFNLGHYEELLKTRINGQHFSPIYIKQLEKFMMNHEIVHKVKRIIEIHQEYERNIEQSNQFLHIKINREKSIEGNFIFAKSSIESYINEILTLENEISAIIDKFIFSKSDCKSKLFLSGIDCTLYCKQLLHYLIGIIMGRYSLDVEGLAYAGGDWDASKYLTYQPDDDGIVPIYSNIGMEDGLTARIIELIKLIYRTDTYKQNIDFISESLGKNNNESSEETLNRYLNDGFYTDHLKIYQKRPIYWMFSSGKSSGFKCLIYMHRYKEDTLALINGKYFLPESTRLKNDIEELLSRIRTSEGRDKIRLEKEREKLAAAYNEAIEYGQVLDHMANKYIDIDLDDGVKVNYAKFQDVELVTDSGTKVKKDLLVPIK